MPQLCLALVCPIAQTISIAPIEVINSEWPLQYLKCEILQQAAIMTVPQLCLVLVYPDYAFCPNYAPTMSLVFPQLCLKYTTIILNYASIKSVIFS